MKNKVEVVKKEKKAGYFYIIPVERNSVSYFAVTHNEVEGLREYGISINKEKACTYLNYFLLKYFDDELIENKIKMGNVSYKDKTNFEWDGKDNFYTLDNIILMRDEMKNISWMLSNDYDNPDLNDICLRVVMAISVTVESVFILYFPAIKRTFNYEKNPKFQLIVNFLLIHICVIS